VIDRLGPGDVVSVVSYDNAARVLVPPTEVGDTSLLTERIRHLQAGGGTALYAGVEEGARQLRAFLADNRVNRIILLSDGQANQGPSSPSALGDLGASLINEGISVTTIGLGLSYNEDLMAQLARRSDGNHSFVEHVDDLAYIFDQEFGDVLSVVAQDVKVTIECKEGIRPVRVLGRDARIDGQSVEVALSQLYSEQDKYILLEVEATPSARGGKQDVAVVTTSYANMVTQETDVLQQTIAARISESEEAVERDLDADAMVSVTEQQGILNEEKAIRLRDEGRQAEAEQVLQDNAAFLEAGAAQYKADALLSNAQKSLEAAANLDGASWNQQRKTLRSDHHKVQRQQSY
jgi:Ca-activated chloride channel family protein